MVPSHSLVASVSFILSVEAVKRYTHKVQICFFFLFDYCKVNTGVGKDGVSIEGRSAAGQQSSNTTTTKRKKFNNKMQE